MKTKREQERENRALRGQIRRKKRATTIIRMIDRHYSLNELAEAIKNGDYADGRGRFWTDDIMAAYVLRRHLVNWLASGAFSMDDVYVEFGRFPKIPEKNY